MVLEEYLRYQILEVHPPGAVNALIKSYNDPLIREDMSLLCNFFWSLGKSQGIIDLFSEHP